ncbi:MAG: 30S ribosomal protein S4 [Candidatus Dojkabacteria bacterium]|nr:30S ribosomal protein S4 [Candidatus Dojkabacteria bacterium]
MARYTGPKDRLSRREGFDLFGKGEKLRRLNQPPGQTGFSAFRRVSIYGRQLREKQKVKRLYGVLERQFRRLLEQAFASPGNSEELLVSLLERRLDNVVYRLGFTPTRMMARQLVNHGHVRVNGKKVTIPSHEVQPGEDVILSSKAIAIPTVKEQIESGEGTIPSWLKRNGTGGRVEREPEVGDLTEDVDLRSVIEFYSR